MITKAVEARAWQAWEDGNFDQAIEAFRRLSADPDTVLSSLIYYETVLAELLVSLGRFQEGLRSAEGTLGLTPHAEAQTMWGQLTAVRSYACHWLGEWDEAEHLRALVLEAPGSFYGSLTLLRDRAIVAIRRGDLEVASETLEKIQQVAPRPGVPGVAVTNWSKPLVVAAHIAESNKEYGAARAHLTEVLRAPALSHSSAHIWTAVLSASRLAWRTPIDPQWTAQVQGAADRLHRSSPIGHAWHTELVANLARAGGMDDFRLWRAAVNAWDKLGDPYECALCRLRLAESLLPGRVEEASAELDLALSAADRLGANPLAGEIIGFAAKARLRLSSPQAAAQDGPLTARERQVLQLVAEGMTNQQLGEALFMSPKTASVHVSRILHKLGAANRAEAITIAFRRGLLADSGFAV